MKKSGCLFGEGGDCGGLLVGTPRWGGIGGALPIPCTTTLFCAWSSLLGASGVARSGAWGPGTEASGRGTVAAWQRGGEHTRRQQPDRCRASPRQGSSSSSSKHLAIPRPEMARNGRKAGLVASLLHLMFDLLQPPLRGGRRALYGVGLALLAGENYRKPGDGSKRRDIYGEQQVWMAGRGSRATCASHSIGWQLSIPSGGILYYPPRSVQVVLTEDSTSHLLRTIPEPTPAWE